MKPKVYSYSSKETLDKLYLSLDTERIPKTAIEDVFKTLSALFFLASMQKEDMEIPFLGKLQYQNGEATFTLFPAVKEALESSDNNGSIDYFVDVFSQKIVDKIKDCLDG